VTYVKVYNSTPEVVYVGYTPGYYGTVVSANTTTVVYGTGWYYPPYIGSGVWSLWLVPYDEQRGKDRLQLPVGRPPAQNRRHPLQWAASAIICAHAWLLQRWLVMQSQSIYL